MAIPRPVCAMDPCAGQFWVFTLHRRRTDLLLRGPRGARSIDPLVDGDYRRRRRNLLWYSANRHSAWCRGRYPLQAVGPQGNRLPSKAGRQAKEAV
jgi:hypothetical protein